MVIRRSSTGVITRTATINIDEDVLDLCREKNINITQVCREALAKKVGSYLVKKES